MLISQVRNGKKTHHKNRKYIEQTKCMFLRT